MKTKQSATSAAVNSKRPTPETGQIVFVSFFNPETQKKSKSRERHGEVCAVVEQRRFEKVIPNYLNKFGERWSLVSLRAPLNAPCGYGTAYPPERVFFTEDAARNNLLAQIDAKLALIQAARGAVLREEAA